MGVPLLRFFLDGELYVLVERRDTAYRDGDFKEVGRWEAEQLLDTVLANADAQAVLREGLSGPAGESGWSDPDGVAQRLRQRLDEDLDDLVLLRRRRPAVQLVLAKPEVIEVVDLADLAESSGDGSDEGDEAWVEVQVLDEDDEPVAGVEYEIELSDGRVERGRTNEYGLLRYDGLTAGECKVTLLSVDRRCWELA